MHTACTMELLSRDSVKKALQHLRAAFHADCCQQYKTAVMEYMEGAPSLVQVAKDEEISTHMKQFFKSKCQMYLDRIQTIKAGLDSDEATIPPNIARDPSQPNMEGLDEESQEMIQNWTQLFSQPALSEVKGAALVKDFLWTNVILPLLCPGLPSSVTKIKRGVLLYGLPGTGKTMLLCAVAAAIACPVARVTACDLIMRRYGADYMVKRLKDLFLWATHNQPCVLLLDDLDVLVDPENDDEDCVRRKVREELILQLKPISVDYQVLVIGATQKPWHLETDRGKLQRKFDRRFHLTLPNSAERVQIFKTMVAGVNHQLSETDLKQIGDLTESFTGADISVLARSCMMEPLRILQTATHFRKVSINLSHGETQELMAPCESSVPGAIPITLEFLNQDRLHIPAVSMDMVEKELARTKASCSEDELKRMNQWAEEFGQD